jgi:hypothetical protein
LAADYHPVAESHPDAFPDVLLDLVVILIIIDNLAREVVSYIICHRHKVLAYIEYRAVSGVFRTIDPPPPLHPASVSSPRTKGWRYTLTGGEGVGGQYFGRRQTLDWPLAV